MRDKVWRTKDGRHIAYRDLDDQHLTNIINMLKRQAETYSLVEWEDYVSPAYYDLMEEADRRKLKYDGLWNRFKTWIMNKLWELSHVDRS